MNPDKSNIAVFTFSYRPFEGGAELAARQIISRLPDFKFTVFTHKFGRNWLSLEKQDNAEIIRLGRGRRRVRQYGGIWQKIFFIFRAWQEAEKLHKQRRFEMIWAVMASYGGIAALFFKLRHPGIPLLLTIQEGDSERHLKFGKFGFVGFLGRKIIKNADYIQAISVYLKDFIRGRGARAPIEVIPNGVDLKLFSTKYTDRELKAVRENLGLSDEYIIITTSRLVFKNAVDVLIGAIAKLKEKKLIVKCLIIGDGPEKEKLKAKSEKLKVNREIVFLGQIPHNDLPLYLKIADVFVRASRSEGLGSSFLEAMAAGVPVIGTPVGGIPDFLKDGQTGFYAKVDDPEDLAQKIQLILRSPALKEKVANNARELVQGAYSWDRIAALFKNIFDRLINL